jgi:hypothetical protein
LFLNIVQILLGLIQIALNGGMSRSFGCNQCTLPMSDTQLGSLIKISKFSIYENKNDKERGMIPHLKQCTTGHDGDSADNASFVRCGLVQSCNSCSLQFLSLAKNTKIYQNHELTKQMSYEYEQLRVGACASQLEIRIEPVIHHKQSKLKLAYA